MELSCKPSIYRLRLVRASSHLRSTCRLQPNALDRLASGMYDKWRYIKLVLGVSHLITSVVATHNSHVTYRTVSNLAVSARTLAVIMCATDYRVVTIWLAQSCPPRPLLYFTFLSRSPLPSRPSLFIALPPDYLLQTDKAINSYCNISTRIFVRLVKPCYL